MENQFLIHYLNINSGNNELISQSTELLLQLYQNFENISYLINLYENQISNEIKSHIGISLKVMNQEHWEQIYQSSLKNDLKNFYLKNLKNELNITTRNTLLDSMIPLFRSELDQWPEFLIFLEEINTNLEFYFSVLSICFSYLPIESIGIQFQLICEKFPLALKSENSLLLSSSLQLFTIVFTVLNAESQIMINIFESLIESIIISLIKKLSTITYLISILTILLELNQPFMDSSQLLEQIINLTLNDEYDISGRVLLIDSINILIQKFSSDLITYFPDIIKLNLHLSELSLIDDCLRNQQDSIFSVSSLEILCDLMTQNEFFEEFWSYYNLDSLNKIASFAIGFIRFMELIPNIIMLHFNDVINFGFTCMNNENHCIMECGITILMELIKRNSVPISNLSINFYQSIFNIFNSEIILNDQNLLESSLSLFVESLYVLTIEHQLLNDIFEKIKQLSNILPLNLQHFIFSAYSGFALASGDYFSDYSSLILPLVLEGASNDNNLIQSRAIESLSKILIYLPQDMIQIYNDSVALFIQCCLQLDDIELFTSSLISLNSISKISNEILNHSIGDIINRIVNFFNIPENDFIEKDLLSSENEARRQALNLIASYIKYQPDLILPYLSSLYLISSRLLESIDDLVRSSALKVSLRACSKLLDEEPNKLIKKLTKLIESLDSNKVSTGFLGLSKLLKLKLFNDKKLISKILEFAFSYFNKQLSCQRNISQNDEEEEENIDNIENNNNDDSIIDLRDSVFEYFASVALYSPSEFLLEDFWTLTDLTEDLNDKIECIGVLVEYYSEYSKNIPNVIRTNLIDTFYQTLEFCDFNYPPHPIAGVRCVIELSNNISPKYLNLIIKYSDLILSSEFEGQFFYWQTISAMISLIFSVYKIVKNKFNLSKYINKIYEISKYCLNESEASNILNSIISFKNTIEFKNNLEFILPTLINASKNFKSLGISLDLLNNINNLINQFSK